MDSTDSNRFACEQEAAVVRQALVLDELDRVQLEQRERTALFTFSQTEATFLAAKDAYISAKAFLDETRARQRALAESTLRKRGLLHPLRKVPECVLRLIFDAAVVDAYNRDGRYLCSESAQDLTYTLAAVCRRWRSAALCAPRLWRFIHLTLRNGRRACSKSDSMTRLLALRAKRSGMQHLRLSLDLAEGVAHNSAYADLFDHIRGLLSRCQSLSVFVPNSWTAFRRGNVSTIFDTTAPALEELHLRAETCIAIDDDDEEYIYSGQDDWIVFLPHCLKLREIVLGNVETHLFRLKDRPDNTAGDAIIWADSMCITDLLWTIRLYPALRTLKAEAPSIKEPDDGRTYPVVTHGSLRHLELSIDKEAITTGLSTNLRLPGLQSAKIDTDGVSYRTEQRLIMSAFISETLANVSVLNLGGARLDEILDCALGGLRNLKDLTLSAGSVDGEVFALTRGQQTQYPALRRLVIDEADVGTGFTGYSLLHFIRCRRARDAAATERSTDRAPILEHVSVSWTSPWFMCLDFDNPGDWDVLFAEAMEGKPAA